MPATMSGPRPRARAAATSPRLPARRPSRATAGERRLRSLSRLAIPERTVPLPRAVEPGAAAPSKLTPHGLGAVDA
jgi:hypothetical protein